MQVIADQAIRSELKRVGRAALAAGWSACLIASFAISHWVLPVSLGRLIVAVMLGGFCLFTFGRARRRRAEDGELGRGFYLGGYLCMLGGVTASLSLGAWTLLAG